MTPQEAQDQAIQRFEEARRGAFDALGQASEAADKLRNGELTSEARAKWKEIYERAMPEVREKQKLAADLKASIEAGRALLDYDAESLRDQPVIKHPPVGSGDDVQLGSSGEDAADDQPPQRGNYAYGPTGQQQLGGPSNIILSGRSRALVNRVLRLGGVKELPQKDREFLTSPRAETLMSPYVNEDGGFVTAEEVRNEVLTHIRDATYIRSRARVIPTTAASVSFPSAKITLSLLKTRAKTGTGQNPTSLSEVFGKQRFTPSGRSLIVKVPEELLEDSTFDIIGFLSQEIALNELESEENLFLNGTGNGEPLGILTALARLDAAGYTGLLHPHSGAGGAFTADDVKQFPYKLRKSMRVGIGGGSASWMSNKAWIEQVSIMRTDEGGAGTGPYMFRVGLEAGDPDTVVGYPLLESEFYPDYVTSGSAGDPMVLFGNWSHYWIVDRKSLDIRTLAEIYTETDEVGFKYARRYDAAPVRAEAFIAMTRKAP